MKKNKTIKTVAIVAGELSGDNLASGLMRELKHMHPNITFFGIGGPKMISEGLESIGDMETLSVMGIIEPLKRLPAILTLRNLIIKRALNNKPDVFIGVDSPDFNLPIERKLRSNGIKTCHYVCPSIWAWRPSRIKNIKKSVDHILTLFPFEESLLRGFEVDSTFVGHPIADINPSVEIKNINLIDLDDDLISKAYSSNNLICVLPGSRLNEVERMMKLFIKVIERLLSQNPSFVFIIPAASEKVYFFIKNYLLKIKNNFKKRIFVVSKQSLNCISLSRMVIATSGTVTLEAAILGKPMVSCYKMSRLSYEIISRMVKTKYFSLPNLLTEKQYVPEFIQDDADPLSISMAVMKILNEPSLYEEICLSFQKLREELSKNSDKNSAIAISNILNDY